jgi:hypothetical protein
MSRPLFHFSFDNQSHSFPEIIQGEEIIIMGFELSDTPIEPMIVIVDDENNFVEYL